MKPVNIDIQDVFSPWYQDIVEEWKPNQEYIDHLKKKIERSEFVASILLVRDDDKYLIVNGHHRYYANFLLGKKNIKAIVIDGSFEDTEPLRMAEVLLKEYDKNNKYKYQFSGYLDRWAADTEKVPFVNTYRPTVKIDIFTSLKKSLLNLWRKFF